MAVKKKRHDKSTNLVDGDIKDVFLELQKPSEEGESSSDEIYQGDIDRYTIEKELLNLDLRDLYTDDDYRKVVQYCLAVNDYYKGSIDGLFGPETLKAITRFKATLGFVNSVDITSYEFYLLMRRTLEKSGKNFDPLMDRKVIWLHKDFDLSQPTLYKFQSLSHSESNGHIFVSLFMGFNNKFFDIAVSWKLSPGHRAKHVSINLTPPPHSPFRKIELKDWALDDPNLLSYRLGVNGVQPFEYHYLKKTTFPIGFWQFHSYANEENLRLKKLNLIVFNLEDINDIENPGKIGPKWSSKDSFYLNNKLEVGDELMSPSCEPGVITSVNGRKISVRKKIKSNYERTSHHDIREFDIGMLSERQECYKGLCEGSRHVSDEGKSLLAHAVYSNGLFIGDYTDDGRAMMYTISVDGVTARRAGCRGLGDTLEEIDFDNYEGF